MTIYYRFSLLSIFCSLLFFNIVVLQESRNVLSFPLSVPGRTFDKTSFGLFVFYWLTWRLRLLSKKNVPQTRKLSLCLSVRRIRSVRSDLTFSNLEIKTLYVAKHGRSVFWNSTPFGLLICFLEYSNKHCYRVYEVLYKENLLNCGLYKRRVKCILEGDN
jgi:hypothetical protein